MTKTRIIFLSLLMTWGNLFAADLSYIPNSGDDTLVRITMDAPCSFTVDSTTANLDRDENTPEDTKPVGVAVSPGGRYVATANETAGTVTVIDMFDDAADDIANKTQRTIAVGNKPFGIVFTPDARKIYVTNSDDDTVSMISTATWEVSAPIAVGDNPKGIAVLHDGSKLLVANHDAGTVSVIDATDHTVDETAIAVGNGPVGIAVPSDDLTAYVANQTDGTVSVINLSNSSVLTTVTVQAGPYGVSAPGLLAETAASNIYVTNKESDSLSIIDPSDYQSVTHVPVGDSPSGVSVSQDGAYVHAANEGDGTVTVIQTSDNTVCSTYTVGTAPVAFGNFLVTTITPPSSLTAVSGTSYTIHLEWTDNTGNESGFSLERLRYDAVYIEDDTIAADVVSYAHSDLRPWSTYLYKIRAYRTVGDFKVYSDYATCAVDPAYADYSRCTDDGFLSVDTPPDNACFIETISF